MTRKNTQRGGWWFTPVKGLYPSYLGKTKRIIYSIRAKIKGTGFQLLRSNSRYQWGLDSTDKNLFLSFMMILNFIKMFWV